MLFNLTRYYVVKQIEVIETFSKARNVYTNTVLKTAMGDSQKALKQFTDAEKNYLLDTEMAPSKFYPQYLLAKLYDETGQPQKAIGRATSLLKQEIKVESTAIDEIHDEMEKIIERNAESDSLLIKNITDRQKGNNNQPVLLNIVMVTLPVVFFIKQSTTMSGIFLDRKEV